MSEFPALHNTDACHSPRTIPTHSTQYYTVHTLSGRKSYRVPVLNFLNLEVLLWKISSDTNGDANLAWKSKHLYKTTTKIPIVTSLESRLLLTVTNILFLDSEHGPENRRKCKYKKSRDSFGQSYATTWWLWYQKM